MKFYPTAHLVRILHGILVTSFCKITNYKMTFLVYWMLFNEHIYLAHLIMISDLIKFHAVTDPITTFN